MNLQRAYAIVLKTKAEQKTELRREKKGEGWREEGKK